ncbi:tyrosine-type recombinase/integrase [Ochrobactrum teleogrylli]|uniref:tyrosine-type recombinase/integrase n=1 Tax=Ochrobactrum teleogrylli TaxID=2479765 RepID=UPI00384DF484
MPKLSKSILDAADIKDKAYFKWCSELPGFGVRIFPNGKKTFYVDYYNQDGQRKRMSIGSFGKLTVEEARKMARITLGDTLRGDDPLLERQTRRGSLTMSELCDNYIKAARQGLIIGRSGKAKKSSTLETDAGRIERHIKPLLGKKLVIDMKRSDVAKFIRDVTAGKTAYQGKSERLRGKIVVAGGAGTAARTTGLLGGILSYAVSEGIIEHNPAHGVKRPADQKRNRRLTADEFKSLGKALSGADHMPWQAIAGIKLLALTGCRLSEIVNLSWDEVDLDAQCIRLGDTKTGASVRPLGKPAVDLLRQLRPEKAKGYLLPGVREPDKSYGSLDGAIDRVMKLANLEGVTAHTLRHSFASVAADLNYSDNTIGAILGHAGSGITSRYTHRLDSVLIAAADEIAGDVKKQMG